MKILLKLLFSVSLIGGLLPSSSAAKDTNNVQCFKHNIQLQLSDSLGFPVDGTQFWITLDIIKRGNLVTIQFPVINFQTGPSANNPAEVPPLLPGGYIYTSDGFLPPDICPNDLVYRSIVAASNNGASLPFSFASTSFPVPPVGYILSVTNAGAIAIQCAGTFGNIIPPGPQILMPADITYIIEPKVSLCKNTIIDSGFTNTTQLPIGLRDFHVNDAFDGVTAWAWVSNANIPDKTVPILNLFVSIGTVNNNGELQVGVPAQLTNLEANSLAADTAIAINRTNKNNIVVSYSLFNLTTNILIPYRAVSFDGGNTWPLNGPLNIQPTGVPSTAGDIPGVRADKFGNFWYSYTNFFDNSSNLINQPTFLISADGGDTYSVAYTAPAPAAGFVYDFPQFCFGEDGNGNYGLWFVVDYFNLGTGDLFQIVGFIPITGLGLYGSPSSANLTSLLNTNSVANIAASSDGRVWIQGLPNLDDGPQYASSYIQPQVISFKSPGPINQNYAGPWDTIVFNQAGVQYLAANTISQLVRGYFTSPQSIIYDDSRQALYAIVSAQYPDLSQNMRLYLIISRDNGQTWSDPIDIPTSDFANRGFQSMALDKVTGNLVFGWYDGRNDPTYQSVQYFGAILPAGQLDALVNKIPLSNPLYVLPPATGIIG